MRVIKKWLALLLRGLPLAGLVTASMLPLPNFSRQVLMLITLLWVQVFFLFDSAWLRNGK